MLKDISDYVGPGSPNPGIAALNTAGGDWTAAIQAMAADVHGGAANAGGDQGWVVLPPGKGVYNGTPLGMYNIAIQGRTPWHSILSCASPLIDVATLVHMHLENFAIFGGTNPIHIGTATDNGGRFRIVDNVEFHGFSGTAFNVTGSDTPYFDIQKVTIDGAANSVGIAFAGYTDNMVIAHNEFRSYKTALRLPGVMQRTKVLDNNFMHVGETSAAPHYDLHITPSPNAGGLADGIGATFDGMWHGSEGRAGNDWFVVIADADSSGMPMLTTPSTGYLEGVAIRDIAAWYTAAATPYIFSTLPGDHMQFNDFGDIARRYLSSQSYSGPMLQLLSTTVPLATTNRVHQWMDLYHTPTDGSSGGSGAGAGITPLRVDYQDGTDPNDPRQKISAAWMNSVGTAINTLAHG